MPLLPLSAFSLGMVLGPVPVLEQVPVLELQSLVLVVAFEPLAEALGLELELALALVPGVGLHSHRKSTRLPIQPPEESKGTFS